MVAVVKACAASRCPSQLTLTVVDVDVGQLLPEGTAPSVTVTVRVTDPAALHVKFDTCEFGALNEPVGADQA